MLRVFARKRFYSPVVAYLSLAVLGAFTFVSMDAPYFEEFTGKNTSQGVILSAPSNPVECLAVNAAKDRSYSTPRQDLRSVIPAIFFAAGAGILCAAVRFITKTAIYNKKNIILLKLRI